jgi:uncharacterized membrane protein YkoI
MTEPTATAPAAVVIAAEGRVGAGAARLAPRDEANDSISKAGAPDERPSRLVLRFVDHTLTIVIVSVILGTASFAADDPKLVAEARIKETEARATALARVRNGTVKSEELEREHGHLIYSYDIAVPGRSGIDEVNVDAVTGKVIAMSHEGPKAERKEADAEAKEKTKPKP